MNQHDIEQIPQFTSTLNEKRSFRDPVSGGELLSDIFNKWRCVFGKCKHYHIECVKNNYSNSYV